MRRIARFCLMFCLLAFSVPAMALVDYDFTRDSWRPSDVDVVAAVDGVPVTEQDVFLWQLVAGRDPFVARLAEEAGKESDPAVFAPLRDAIRDGVMAYLIVGRLVAAPPIEEVILVEERLRLAPIAAMILADRVVRPSIEIESADIAFHYQQNENLFYSPAEATVLRLAVPLEDLASASARREALARASALRDQAVEAGGLLDVLTENPGLAIDKPVGRTVTLTAGDPTVRADILDEVFGLAINQISPPIVTADSVIMYEVTDRRDASRRPFEEVSPEIRNVLGRRFFLLQFDVLRRDLLETNRAIDQSRFFGALEPGMEVLVVGNFVVSKEVFQTIFSRFSDPNQEVTPELRNVVQRIREGEVLAQEVERRSLANDPRFRRGEELARLYAKASHARRGAPDLPEPEREELEAYAEANREKLAPEKTSVFWRLVAKPRTPAELTGARREEVNRLMRERLEAITTEGAQLLDERARINSPAVYVTPQFVIDRLIGSPDERFLVEFEQAGVFGPAEATTTFAMDLGDLEVGNFTPPRLQGDGTFVSIYKADEREDAPPTDEELLERAREAWLREQTENPALDQIEALESSKRLEYFFPTDLD